MTSSAATLSDRVLTRTLWLRQHLVPGQRRHTDPADLVGHLIGLQAQDNLPPYLALAARLDAFDPEALSAGLEDRSLVRFRTMRGTVHVLTPTDATTLRPWVQPTLDRVSASNAINRPAAHLTDAGLEEAVRALLAGGAMPNADLAERLHERHPEVPVPVLRHVTPERVPLLQTPPRGQWKRSGGVVYALADEWLGRPFAPVDLPELVCRYLRAYGPATPADMTTWSAVTRLGPVFTAMRRNGELVTYVDERGRTLYDVPDGVLADEDLDLPTTMLGTYDNLFLSHADRARVAPEDARKRWSGRNGAVGSTLFVDGLLTGMWRVEGGRVVVEPFRALTTSEQRAVVAEQERVATLLAR